MQISTTEKITPSPSKLLGLELLRFFCALSVLLWHYQHFFYIENKPINFDKELQPLYLSFNLLYDYGFYAVQIFWCISGFIFFWHYKNVIANNIINSKRFFILRFSRLYPLHILTLTLVALLQFLYFSKNNLYFVYQNNDLKHFILQLFLASNWGFQTGDSFNGPIWSISVETMIYFFFFLTLRFLGGSALINIGIVALCLMLKVAHIPSSTLDTLINCLTLFYLGGLSAIAFQHFERTKYKKIISNISICITVLTPFLVYKFNLYEMKNFSFKFLMIYTPILIYSSALAINVNLHSQKIIEALGNMTYSSYLIHFPIQIAIVILYGYLNKSIPYYSLYFFVTFILTTLVSSYLLYKYFEKPSQRYIRNKFK